ncbi:MAG: hypothetical protein CL882_03480 [Dehalococcoidia bacterium]|nr:hypothetical protein [Dehalococcoidia bacterium]
MSVKDVEGWKEKCFYILEDEVRYEFGEFVDENELKEILASVYGDLDWCRASELLDDEFVNACAEWGLMPYLEDV